MYEKVSIKTEGCFFENTDFFLFYFFGAGFCWFPTGGCVLRCKRRLVVFAGTDDDNTGDVEGVEEGEREKPQHSEEQDKDRAMMDSSSTYLSRDATVIASCSSRPATPDSEKSSIFQHQRNPKRKHGTVFPDELKETLSDI